MGQFQRVPTTYDTDHILSIHVGIASMGQFQLVPTTYDTEKKGNHFEINAYQVSCPLSVPLYNMSVKISVTILQIVYINMTALSPNLI